MVHLIKRKCDPSSPKTLPANELKALFWYKWLVSSLLTFAIYGHAVFMSVAYLLVMFWPPYQQAFIVTNWIANILPHSIFGVLAVTQEQLNTVGATLTRAAHIHFIVPQLIMAIIYLLWTLLNCEAYLRRIYVNFDERKAGICERKKSFVAYCDGCFASANHLASTFIRFSADGDRIRKKPGLMS